MASPKILKRGRTVLSIALVAAFSCDAASVITPDQINLLTAVTMLSVNLLDLALEKGVSYDGLQASGTYAANGWTLDVTDNALNSPLSLSYLGQYDPIAGTGSWNGSGLFGSSSLLESGTFVLLSDSQGQLDDLFIDPPPGWGGAIGVTVHIGPDHTTWEINGTVTPGKTKDSVNGSITIDDSGIVAGTVGVAVPFRPGYVVSVAVQGSAQGASYHAEVGSGPEPTTLWLSVTGLAALIIYLGRRAR